jgi:hypothetical protein
MGTVTVNSNVKHAQVSYVVIRCGCSSMKRRLQSLFGIWHAQKNQSCPTPKCIEDHGVVASYDAQPQE